MPDSASDAELKPCPFCGGEANWQTAEGSQAVNFDDVHRLNCSWCCRVDMPWWSVKADCVKDWNTRALSRTQAETGAWRPIDTTPTCVDVLVGCRFAVSGLWFQIVAQKVPARAGAWVSDGGEMTLVPTHWMPLPSPPPPGASS